MMTVPYDKDNLAAVLKTFNQEIAAKRQEIYKALTLEVVNYLESLP